MASEFKSGMACSSNVVLHLERFNSAGVDIIAAVQEGLRQAR